MLQECYSCILLCCIADQDLNLAFILHGNLHISTKPASAPFMAKEICMRSCRAIASCSDPGLLLWLTQQSWMKACASILPQCARLAAAAAQPPSTQLLQLWPALLLLCIGQTLTLYMLRNDLVNGTNSSSSLHAEMISLQ